MNFFNINIIFISFIIIILKLNFINAENKFNNSNTNISSTIIQHQTTTTPSTNAESVNNKQFYSQELLSSSAIEICPDSYFTCHDGKCIPYSWRCDSKVDCYDGSDENMCKNSTICNDGQFQCNKTKICIPKSWKCDQDFDCGADDFSDELNCSDIVNKCLSYQSFCSNGLCLDISKFCDGTWDCDSDEANCVVGSKLCLNLTCAYECKFTSLEGAKCYCPPGQEPNGTLCQDFNECSIDGMCDQICKNTHNSYECSCVSGYMKNGNNCHAINVPKNENASLILLTHDNIKRISLTGGKISSLENQKASAIEMWHRNSTICAIYTRFENPPVNLRCHKINNLTEYYVLPIPDIMYSIESIEQIRIDWIAENLYFLSNELGIIFMCTSNLKYCSIILQNVSKPSSIALDPTKGFLFFTEWSASLSRSSLDGTSKINLVTSSIYYPTGITLDLPNEHVYWIDVYTDFVERVDYDGKNRWSLKKGIDNHLILKSLHSIDIFENLLYISSWHDNSVIAMNKFTLNATRISLNLRATDLRVHHRQKQPEVAHPCRNPPNGNCDQICIPLWKNDVAIAKCICSSGYILKNKNQCIFIKHDKILFYTKQKLESIKGVSVLSKATSYNNQDAIVPIYNVSWPETFDFNVKDQRIYFVQSKRLHCAISSQKFDGSDRRTEFETTYKFISFVAYDYISDHIYWVNGFYINVGSLKNSSLILSFYIAREPMSLAVDPENGLIYWSHWLSGEQEAVIQSSWMDGSHKRILINNSNSSMNWPLSLNINKMDKKIYWCDVKTNTIERMNLDGTKHEILFSNTEYNPISIAVLKNFIYWVDDRNGTIMKLRIDLNETERSKSLEIVTVEQDRIPFLKAYDSNSQKETNGCVDSVCPGLCLNTPQKAICKCPNGYSLNGSGNHCIAVNIELNCTNGFVCKDSKQCIDAKMVCDGEYQCEDGSDESFGSTGPCNVNNCDKNINFQCDNRCFQRSLLCSSVNYCKDGTDQLNCSLRQCMDTEFMCYTSKKCIPVNWVHDGAFDCGPNDNSDEMESSSSHDECTEFECKNGHCIPFVNMCDGVNNCGDDSDEESCQCGDNEKYCLPIGCYDSIRMCDGINDCLDFSDEANCNGTEIKSDNFPITMSSMCSSNEFLCNPIFECIPKKMVCDGIPQCLDKSDEINCTLPLNPNVFSNETEECIHPDRLCKPSNKCIRVHELCDGKLDCIDGTDEGLRCSEKLCNRVTDCSHFCHNAPEGFVCSCPLHQFLQPNGLHCSMEHSCDNFGTCSQTCEKKGRTYECKCHDNYALEYDKFTCKSINNDTPYVIFSNRQEIRAVDLRSSAVKSFYTSLKNTIALDFLYKNNSIQIFWTDVLDDKIFRGTLIGDSITQVETVVQNGLSTAEGLAVDWIGLNLYWIDSNLDQIEVSLVNGSFRRTLVAGDMESPRAITLDPRMGLLFWTDWDENFPRIEQCSMAGEARKSITQVNQVNGWPNGLTLDYENYRVYWVDARSDSIHTIKYDGSDHHLVIKDQDTLSHPFAITLFENYIYWTDWRTTSVIRANKWNGSDIQVIQRTLTQPFGIQILHSSRQPKSDINPCGQDNGGCSHLCLLSLNKAFKCECPHVMRLDLTDNKTCVPNEQVLLFIMGNEIRGIDLINPSHHTIPTISHSPQVLAPQRLDFLVKGNRLYWSDTQLNEIKTAGLADGYIKTVINTEIQKPFGFAIDWISNIIFMSSGKQKCQIYAANLEGEYVTEIHNDLNVVESIALDPVNGKMYWSHSDKETKIYKLEVSNLDGSYRHILYNSSYPVQSLSMEYRTNRIYFVVHKFNFGQIYYMDWKTRNITEVLSSDIMSISSVAVYNNSLYFPENIQSAIMSCNMDNCSQTLNILRKNTNSIQALKMFHLDAQQGENSCSDKIKNKCDQLCFAISNTEHVCKCAIGFYKDLNDTNKCIAKSEFIFYSISHELKGMEIMSNDNPITNFKEVPALGPISRVSLATNIDYYIKENYLFWADSEKGTITRIKRDGTNRKVILKQRSDQLDSNSLDWLGGIAVDWVAGNLYWSDNKRNTIEVARINGSFRYVIASVENPTMLAVDPINGYLFYAATNGKIIRTGLDGSLPFILVNQTKNINNIILDIKDQKVYWCEINTNVMMRVDYDGNLKSVMFNHTSDHITALALLDDYLFWTDNNVARGSIKIAPIHNLSNFNILIRSEGNPIKDLKIFSERVQTGTNLCGENNGGCAQLCLFNGTYPTCACSYGKVSSDGKLCEDYDQFVIFSKGTGIESIHMTDHNNKNAPINNIFNPKFMRNVIGISYDYDSKKIFYSDIHLNSINWVYFNGSQHTVIVNGQMTVEGLTYDNLNSQLYWTSNNDASIRALYLQNSTNDIDVNKKLVKQIIKLSVLDKPRGIEVESCLGMIYWTNWNSQAPSIQRAYITGYGLETIIKTDIRMPNALTFDLNENKLYWSDARLDKIERCDYDGKHRIILAHSTLKHPFGMAIYGDLLFWTDWVLHSVIRANKYSGSDAVILRSNLGRPMGIATVQNKTKNCDANACKILNGGCEDVCILDKDGKANCACTRGYLAPNKRNCLLPSVTKCTSDQFRCGTGECIPFQLTCDKISNCQDGSDEQRSYCIVRSCPPNFFMCQNHRCIYLNQTCDGIQHCEDGSDERPCGCAENTFKCSSGECLLNKYRCDNDPDCKDASDEMNCPQSECSQDDKIFIHCNFTTACYLPSWRCDNENDCWDNSDEEGCENSTKPPCGVEQFRCANGQCINQKWRCDSERDCSDGSDEINCENLKCKSNEFKCGNSCIPSTWQCDGTPDCPDESDEGSQCAQSECKEFMFKCTSSGRCIPQKWVCDGEPDCIGREDEHEKCAIISVTHIDQCPPPNHLCPGGVCLESVFVCDGDADCKDGSDEYECETKPPSCLNHPELCDNKTKVCEPPDYFECKNGACVHVDKLCDSVNDCGTNDWSDEENCNVNECESPDVCEHECKDLKVGYECICKKGFKQLQSNKHLCEDIDECSEKLCSQRCINTYGSYHCSCVDGYELKDHNICKAVSNETAKIIFTNRYYIRQVNIQGNEEILIHQLSNAVALDYEWKTKCLYWSDVTSSLSTIKKYCPNENKTTTLHQSSLKNPDGLAVDWIGENLYWCDKGLDTIEVSKLDGKFRKILINKNLKEPRAIVLDPFKKYFYWSDWGDTPYIGKSGMDGTNQKIIIEENLGWPNALTISFETNELFFGDAREDYIAVSDLDGKNIRIVLERSTNPLFNINLHHIFAIAVWENKIYWSDWEKKSIEYCNKYESKNCSTLITTIHRPMDVRVFHPFRQKPVENPCSASNCSTLCLLSPELPYYRCACPNNFILDTDGKSCIANCTSAHYLCEKTYKCIPFYYKCDGEDDCGDLSDEPESCPKFICEPGQFQCENLGCISPNAICDGTDNCGDKSDENDCDKFTCFDNSFKCPATKNTTSFCIENLKKCDGFEDCPNNEDEVDCTPIVCQKNQFQCANNRCIPQVWVCDGDSDCPGQEDENKEQCNAKRTCLPKEFKCSTGRCIPVPWRCDGEKDCPGGEDESQCDVVVSCEPTYHKCNNSKCIPGRWKCDYEDDCGDGSDETNCEMRKCSESEFRCVSSGKCIKYSNRCDGEIHCKDKSDELDCNITCSGNKFKCLSTQTCINSIFKCDGDEDCADGSDEVNCTCSHDHFSCGNNKQCILKRWLCDGFADCADNSDESLETCGSLPCHSRAFKCPNQLCIRNSSLCDGIDDCGDGTDEIDSKCSSLPRCRYNQFQCENHVCISSKFRCDGMYHCTDGSDELNCQPTNCRFGTCSQICVEKKTSFACKCLSPGYKKGSNKNDTCEATGVEKIMLLASEQEFRFIFPQKHEGSSPIVGFFETGSIKIDVFDVLILHEDDALIFWIDSHHNKIHKMKIANLSDIGGSKNNEKKSLSKRSLEELTAFDIPNLADPKSLAVDWINSLIYIIDSRHNKIIVTDISGKYYLAVVDTGMNPTDLVLDPESRLLIWSTLENGILASSLDGSFKRSLVETDVGWPISLSIDYPTGRLYWADYRKGTIETCLLNGKDRHLVRRFSNTEKPQKIDVFEDTIYIKLYDQSIIRMDKFGFDNGTYLLKGHRSSDIGIIHPMKQNRNISNPCFNNPCEKQNGLCILSENKDGYACKCPAYHILIQNNTKEECKSIDDMPSYCPLKCRRGHCKVIDHVPKCICDPQFDGELCQHYRCSGYCQNQGLCTIDVSSYSSNSTNLPPLRCACPPNWSGARCETSVPDCQSRCHNGGQCVILEEGIQKCDCPDSFVGDKCEHCFNLTCRNGGICRETNTESLQCDCPDGFIGKSCEINVCDDVCKNGGECTIELQLPRCTCSSRYQGNYCEIDLCETSNPPLFCDELNEPSITPCTNVKCHNGGFCHVVRNEPLCNCTAHFNGRYCETLVEKENPCVGYCLNGGICRLDELLAPNCVCIGEWNGDRCDTPPPCLSECGLCQIGSSINECLCDNDEISNCIYDNNDVISEQSQSSAKVFTILSILISIIIILILVFGVAIYFLRRLRINQPFSHARLTDNVEITNPMYLGDIDEAPSFVQEDDKGNFANPVYESMYAGMPISEQIVEVEMNCSTGPSDERKGLLQHSNEETNTQAIL